MCSRNWILSFCLVLLATPIANAAKKQPTPGSVTCYCSCPGKNAKGQNTNYTKIIGGTEGTWSQSRANCQAFTGSSCSVQDSSGRWHYGKLTGCDTHVHRTDPGGGIKPQAPVADTLAPANEDGGNKLKLRLKKQLLKK